MPALTHNDAQTNKQTIKYRQVRYLIYKWSGGCISVTVLGIYYNYYGYYLNVFYKYSLSRSPANIHIFIYTLLSEEMRKSSDTLFSLYRFRSEKCPKSMCVLGRCQVNVLVLLLLFHKPTKWPKNPQKGSRRYADGRMFRFHTLYHASEEPVSLSHTLAKFPAILSYLWTLQASLHGAQLLLLHLTHALTHDTATSVRNVADNNDKASLSGAGGGGVVFC